jgi:formylglycine-generating enzyme required for sulfatase activity
MGMPLELGWLLLDDGQRRIIHTHGQREVHLTSLARLAQRSASGQAVHLQTPTLAMQLGQIVPPFGFEHGRDEVGLYALCHLNGQVLRLRYIEPGEFLMGSPKHEAGRDEDEGPQHRVVISHGFWLGEVACTQALWQAVMGNNPSRFDEKNGGGPQHPVEQVSWLDVQQFLHKLNQSLPPDFPWQASLPTEAEWEYACRAGTITPFWFGANIRPDQVNYDGNYLYAGAATGMYRECTVAVDALPCNDWGLYQMHGNVWEWCADRYGADAYAKRAGKVSVDPGLAQAWQPDFAEEGPCSVRGGGWSDDARRARSACRFRLLPVGLYVSLGFRLALRSRPR